MKLSVTPIANTMAEAFDGGTRMKQDRTFSPAIYHVQAVRTWYPAGSCCRALPFLPSV